MSMKRTAIILVVLLAGGSASAQSVERRVDAPFRFSSPSDRPVSGLDAEKGRSYQDQLRGQLRNEERHQIDRNAEGAARLRETRRELDRMDNVLRPGPVTSPPPAVERHIPPSNRGPLGDNGPVVASGGHPQPTPAEIEEREKQRRQFDRERKAVGIELGPVYDLYGNRIQ